MGGKKPSQSTEISLTPQEARSPKSVLTWVLRSNRYTCSVRHTHLQGHTLLPSRLPEFSKTMRKIEFGLSLSKCILSCHPTFLTSPSHTGNKKVNPTVSRTHTEESTLSGSCWEEGKGDLISLKSIPHNCSLFSCLEEHRSADDITAIRKRITVVLSLLYFVVCSLGSLWGIRWASSGLLMVLEKEWEVLINAQSSSLS